MLRQEVDQETPPANDTRVTSPLRVVSEDSPVARAIAVMQRDLTTQWTVPLLARAARSSRTTLGRRFVEETGVPPLRYLTRLRMERAAELLRDPAKRLADVAPAVGYGTEFALNRAFKRQFGLSPGRFRVAGPVAGGTRTRMAA